MRGRGTDIANVWGKVSFFSHERVPSPGNLIGFMSDKYYTANTYQMIAIGQRKTLEFRPMGAEGCLDSYLAGNWIKLIMHFVEMTQGMPYPKRYKKGGQVDWIALA